MSKKTANEQSSNKKILPLANSTPPFGPIGKATRAKAPKPGLYDRETADTPRQAAIYSRVSSQEQIQGQSIEVQERICREFIQREKPNWTLVEVFRDEGYSGKSDKRPGFQELIDWIDQGKINAVICHHLDRFSRSIHDIMVYFKKFEDQEVYLSFADEHFDFSTPEGRMHFNILAVFADWYLKNLSRETMKSKSNTVFNQQQNNQSPFGYTFQFKGTPQIIPEEAELVRQLFEMYATGRHTDGSLAEWMQAKKITTRKGREWTKESIRSTLQLDYYYGVVKHHDKLYPGSHEPIIDRKLFNEVQKIRKLHYRQPRSNTKKFERVYLLNSIIRCSVCQRNLRAHGIRDKYRYYREVSDKRGFSCPRAGKKITADMAEAQIAEIIHRFELPKNWQKEIQATIESRDEVKFMREKRQELEEKLQRLSDIYVDGAIRREDYEHRRNKIRAELDSIITPSPGQALDSGRKLESFKQVWGLAEPEDQREMVQLLFEWVEVDLETNQISHVMPKRGFNFFFDNHPMLEKEETGGYKVLDVFSKNYTETA